MSEGDETSRITRRLDRQFLADQSDAYLLGLALLADGSPGLPLAVGMLLDGVVVHGVIVSVERFAEQIDAALLDMLERSVGVDDARDLDWSPFVGLAKHIRQEMEEATELRATYPPDATIDDFADEHAPEILKAMPNDTYVQLTDAHVFSATPRRVGAMRVRTDRIAAWWPLTAEEGVVIDYVTEAPSSEA